MMDNTVWEGNGIAGVSDLLSNLSDEELALLLIQQKVQQASMVVNKHQQMAQPQQPQDHHHRHLGGQRQDHPGHPNVSAVYREIHESLDKGSSHLFLHS